MFKTVLVALCLAVSACATNPRLKSNYEQHGSLPQKYFTANVMDKELEDSKDSVAVYKKLSQDHGRGFRPENAGRPEGIFVEFVVQTPALIREQFLIENHGNSLMDKKTIEQELIMRIKSGYLDRTCFNIFIDNIDTLSSSYQGYAYQTTNNYNSSGQFTGTSQTSVPQTYTSYYDYKTKGEYNPKNWNGVITSGKSVDTMPLRFGNMLSMACTKKPWNFDKPLYLLSLTQGKFDSDQGWGMASWLKGEDDKPEHFEAEFIKEELKKGSPEPLEFYAFGSGSTKDKVVLNALKTGQKKFVYQELPDKFENYSPSDRLSLLFLASAEAQMGASCDAKLVEYLFKIGALKSPSSFKMVEEKTNGRIYDCPAFAREAFVWLPGSRDKIYTDVSNKFFDTVGNLGISFSLSEYKKLMSLVPVYKLIHKHQSQLCTAGQREQCVLAESNKENMKLVKPAIDRISRQKDQDQRAREILEQILRNEKARQQQKPGDYI